MKTIYTQKHRFYATVMVVVVVEVAAVVVVY